MFIVKIYYISLKVHDIQVYMAKIVQSLTQPTREYDQMIQQSFVRDVDSVVQKLNTTFQQDMKDEVEAFNLFLS